mgnify:FL=1
MSKNDQRIRLTKMLIRKAFTELLQNKPVQSISVKELCTAAGINRGTFYAHYTDIYDLMHQIEDEMMDTFLTALKPLLNADSSQVTPLKITTEIFQCLKENADLCAVTLGKYGDKEFASRLLAIGREKCMECYVKYFTDATPKQIEYYYTFVSAGCIGILEKWLHDGMTSSPEELACIAENIMMKGIAFLKG